jgi:hypothetical protein
LKYEENTKKRKEWLQFWFNTKKKNLDFWACSERPKAETSET